MNPVPRITAETEEFLVNDLEDKYSDLSHLIFSPSNFFETRNLCDLLVFMGYVSISYFCILKNDFLFNNNLNVERNRNESLNVFQFLFFFPFVKSIFPLVCLALYLAKCEIIEQSMILMR